MPGNEEDLIRSVEAGEWVPVDGQLEWRNRLQYAAKKTSSKDFRLNIRVSQADIEAIKVKALQEGLPYQTLIASILHKYAKGRLTEV